MTAPPNPQPGWYPDPSDPRRQRYFDGRAWTENYAPFGPPLQYAQPAKQGMNSALKILLGLGAALLAVVVLGTLFSGGKSDDNKSNTASTPPSVQHRESSSAPAEPAADEAAPAGSTVRDGKFEFQVLGVERSATKPGMFDPEQAKGEFFTVNLRITNIGDDARTFFASNQHLIVNGNNYDASSSISDEHWMEDINPGLSIQASVTFDIPPGATPEAIKCHDSAFSGGALLAL